MNRRDLFLMLGLAPFVAQAAEPAEPVRNPTQGKLTQPKPTQARPTQVTVYKSESCGCCKLWVQHLLQAGFVVQAHDVDNMGPIKERVGVPPAKGSCHTAEVGGYFVEGHVPADDIKRLLRERPAARGLTVPGMPLGSPGMEVASGQVDPYEVLLVRKDGSTTVFAKHGS